MIDVEDINEVPEKYRGDYVEVKDGDKTIYRNKAFVAVKEANDKYKSRMTAAEEKAAKLDAIEAERAEEKRKAEENRIKGLHDKKEFEPLYKELEQKYKDLEKRSGETAKQFQDRENQLKDKINSKAVDSLLGDLSELFTDAGKKTGKRLLKDMIKYDAEEETYTFLDEDGGVTSLDVDGFKSYVENSDLYASLLKAKTSTGGFGKNAQKGGGAARKFTEYSPAELSDIQRTKPTEYARLVAEHKNTA